MQNVGAKCRCQRNANCDEMHMPSHIFEPLQADGHIHLFTTHKLLTQVTAELSVSTPFALLLKPVGCSRVTSVARHSAHGCVGDTTLGGARIRGAVCIIDRVLILAINHALTFAIDPVVVVVIVVPLKPADYSSGHKTSPDAW